MLRLFLRLIVYITKNIKMMSFIPFTRMNINDSTLKTDNFKLFNYKLLKPLAWRS
jgi:hypothetical protein